MEVLAKMRNNNVKLPGKPYDVMRWMVAQRNAGGYFTTELILAIFWEETFFNNVRQTPPGTAVGFGQVEPAELKKVNDKYGLNLSIQTILGSEMTSVEATIRLLQYYTEDRKSTETALRAYAGYWYKKDKTYQDERQAIINNWKSCASGLMTAGGDPAKIKAALNIAREFKQDVKIDLGRMFHERLFPDQSFLRA